MADDSAGQVDGLHATRLGERGQTLVFCHGLFGQGKNWTQVAKQFTKDHRALLVDLPDHGRSPWSERFGFVSAADQVADLLSPDDPVALVGHSLGGKVAMLLALRHPELVERLCVVDVSPVAYQRTGEFARFIDAMRNLDVGAITRRDEADEGLREAVPDDTVRSFLLQNLRRDGSGWRWQVNLDVLGRDLEVLGGWPEAELADAASYDGPVLWVAGERSNYVRPEHQPAMERWFPKARKVTVKGAGHWLHSERPEVFVEVLRRFLVG